MKKSCRLLNFGMNGLMLSNSYNRDVIIPLLKEHFGAAIDAVKNFGKNIKIVIEKVMK